MIGSLIFASLLSQAAGTTSLSAADFFPLVKDSTRTYKESTLKKGSEIESVDEVAEDVRKGKAESTLNGTRVITRIDGRTVSNTYYEVLPDGVYINGYAADEALSDPIPVFKFSGKETHWIFDAKLRTKKQVIDQIHSEGVAKLGPVKTVLGKPVPTLEVVVETTRGESGPTEKITQVSVYAKGYGLVSMTTRSYLLKKNKPEIRSLELVAFQDPKQ